MAAITVGIPIRPIRAKVIDALEDIAIQIPFAKELAAKCREYNQYIAAHSIYLPYIAAGFGMLQTLVPDGIFVPYSTKIVELNYCRLTD